MRTDFITQIGKTTFFLLGLLCFTACEKDTLTPDFAGNSQITARVVAPLDVYALTNTNQVIKYVYNGSFTEQSTLTVTGLQGGEMLLSIDFRPATGQLYAVSNQSRVYFINLNSGAATTPSLTPFTPAINGTKVGLDFNPTVDRIRLVTENEQNLRLNPETGGVAATDLALNSVGGPVDVTAVAYTNSFAGATTTVLYDLDVVSDGLYKQNPPNNGTLEFVGSLGVDALDAGGFDISPDSKTAIATLMVLNNVTNAVENRFYLINLTTGAATYVSVANINIIGLSIRTYQVGYAISKTTGNLLILNLDKGGSITKTVTGLQSGESLLGIDMRPATGQLFGLGSTSRLYAINMASGAATAIGSGPFTPALAGTNFGFDFNPTVDRIRIVSNTGQNLRANPITGVIAFTDMPLNPGTPSVDAVAYTNNFAGATTTTLYDADALVDKLFTQVPPNNGTLVEVGNFTTNLDASNGLDIGGTSGNALGIFSGGSVTLLYSFNLSTGKATPVMRLFEQVNGFALGLGF